jgi:hypothetical protein
MIPKFSDTQTPAERATFIAKVRTSSHDNPEAVEADLSREFAKCGMKLRIADVNAVGVYDAGEKAFRATHTDPSVPSPQHVSGPGFSEGLLADLLEAHAIMKRLGLSFEAFADEFRNNHLTCVQEILALGEWRYASNVVRDFKAGAGKKNVDWKFDSKGVTVLLEVKYRRTDWRRNHPETIVFNAAALFADIAGKFGPAAPNAWRVAHVTVVQPIDDTIAAECSAFLKTAPLDAIILEPLDQRTGPFIFGNCTDEIGPHLGADYIYVRPPVVAYAYRRPSMRLPMKT